MSNNDIAISVKDVSKSFKLPHEKQSSVKGAFINVFRGKRTFEKQKVLDEINFEIKKGEFFGIVGRNGSGKSTLLKLLAGIYSPASGAIQVNGKLTPFIELGVGFNPELTGRENVFLNGSLLGFSRKEMEKMYDKIVEFAELDKFMDQKLKNYSSGMQVRLAFSIAIRANSGILLFDEVLAVGDAAFQKKCNQVFSDLKKQGKTIILVSHDMNSVKKFCTRVAVINNGIIKGIYTPSEAASVYEEINSKSIDTKQGITSATSRRWGDGKVRIKDIKIYSEDKRVKENKVYQGDNLKIIIELGSKIDSAVMLGLMFEDEDGVNISGPNSKGVAVSSKDTVSYYIDKLSLAQGLHRLTVAVFSEDLNQEHDHIYNALSFKVMQKKDHDDTVGKVNMFGRWSER